MVVFSLALVIGLIILIWSADRFVEGAVSTALNLGMTPMMVGLTVVAFGTSAPELIVSLMAALQDSSNLAVGNAVGSNIANIALVLGVTTLVSAIPIKLGILKVELPILVLATGCATLVIMDGVIEFDDGLILVGILIVSLIALAKLSHSEEIPEEVSESDTLKPAKAYLYLFGSLLVLVLSSRMLVWGASGIATELGVSDLVIGLTIVAIGTSLPELAASIASALKGHHDLALGNIIGSNIFNLATVLPLPALIAPGLVDANVISRDYPWVLGLTVALAIAIYLFKKTKNSSIPRWVGLPLIASYGIYLFVISANGAI